MSVGSIPSGNANFNKGEKKMTIKNAHFVDKYYWIMDHPLNRVSEINFFQNEIDIQPQLVNPMTNEVDRDDSLNTKVEFWVEFSYFDVECEANAHDIEFDCGGDSYEEAVEALFQLVYDKFGDYNMG